MLRRELPFLGESPTEYIPLPSRWPTLPELWSLHRHYQTLGQLEVFVH